MNIHDFKAILCDLDGCLISGETALPGAHELLDRAGDRLYVLSNNSTDTAATLAARLRALGLDIPEHRLFLAGVAALQHIAVERPHARVAIYGSKAIVEHADGLGLARVDDRPDLLLLTRDDSFCYATLRRILGQLEAGAEIVVANPDLTHPGDDGVPVPETGSLLAWIRTCAPTARYTVIGKPGTTLYRSALRLAAVDAGECLCIGDNRSTDGAGAERMGMAFAWVRHAAGHQGLRNLLTPETV